MKHINTTVSIVEDDAGIRSLLTEWLTETPNITCLEAFESAEEALVELPRLRPKAEIVLTDINLPGMNGIELIRQLKPMLPKTQFLMLTVYGDTEHIFQALQAGAVGYLLKRAAREELIAAIQLVSSGGSPMSSGLAQYIMQSVQTPVRDSAGLATLSPRETEILNLLARGHIEKQIAAEIHISQHTVHAHIRSIYEKLQVHSHAHAVAKYGQLLHR